jgi:hypothetical protein
MTARKSIQRTNDGSKPTVKRTAACEGARVVRNIASFDLSSATFAVNDTLGLGKVPKGAEGISHRMTSSVSLATSTIAIGIAGTTGKYRAAAVFTAVDTPTAVGLASILDDVALTADEDQIATIAVANLPAAGFLTIETFYTLPGR